MSRQFDPETTRMTPQELAKAIKESLAARTSKPFPTQEEIDEMNGLQFLRLRLENYEGWDYDSERCRLDQARVHAIEVDRKERASRSAKNPRPRGRHPRKAEALEAAQSIAELNPSLKRYQIATRVAARMDGDDIPNFRTIAGWMNE